MPRAVLPPHVSVEARVYRATSYDVPLRVAENRRSGRWNIAHAGAVQYLCFDAEAPFAEKIRHEDLRTEAEVATYTTTLWELRVHEGVVVDYSTFEKAEDAGFRPRRWSTTITNGAGGRLSGWWGSAPAAFSAHPQLCPEASTSPCSVKGWKSLGAQPPAWRRQSRPKESPRAGPRAASSSGSGSSATTTLL